MKKTTANKKNDVREKRITDEIVVDANGPEERSLGWCCYLEDVMKFPFKAKCITTRASSPVALGEVVDVVGMAGADECEHEMHVEIVWTGRALAVPLAQLSPIDASEKTVEAIEDWHYWVGQGFSIE